MPNPDPQRPDRLVNVRLGGGAHVDIALSEGRIAAIAPADPAARGAPGTVDGQGGLVTVPFVDGHIHLDKSLVGHGHVPHRPGEAVRDRIRIEKALLREVGLDPGESGQALLERAAARGTLALRSHVDIDPETGLRGLEALLALRERWRGVAELQIVAFPQSGLVSCPGTAELLDAALAAGADLVGGLDPAGIDGDVDGQLDIVFDLALRHGAGIDIHLHDGGETGLAELREIAARTRAAGLAGRVAVSHAFALGEALEIGPTVEALAGAGVAIMTHAPGPVPMPPVMRLRAAGVEVFSGSDNIRDAWSPFGNADMLERAMIVGYRQGANLDAELAALLDLVTHAGRRALGLAEARIAEGAPADLVVLAEPDLPGALADHGPRRLVMKGGRILAADGRATAALP